MRNTLTPILRTFIKGRHSHFLRLTPDFNDVLIRRGRRITIRANALTGNGRLLTNRTLPRFQSPKTSKLFDNNVGRLPPLLVNTPHLPFNSKAVDLP